MLAHFKHGWWLLSSLRSHSRGHGLEYEIIVVGESQPGEDNLPQEVQDGRDHAQQAELDDNFRQEAAPAESPRLAGDLQLEVEAVGGPGDPLVPLVPHHLPHLVAGLGEPRHPDGEGWGKFVGVRAA